MTDTLVPEASEWSAVWIANRAAVEVLKERLGEGAVRSLREEALEAARVYTSELVRVAADAGVSLVSPAVQPYGGGIVAAGHQPVIYHPGLSFKNQMLSQFARQVGASALNVIVDTDEGDAGKLVWPEIVDGMPVLRDASVSTPAELFIGQKVADPRDTRTVFGRMEAGLKGAGLAREAGLARQAGELYERLSCVDIAAANSIVRWTNESRAYLEIPLSRLVQVPTVEAALRTVVVDPHRTHAVYNRVLDEFRAERKIKNPANPFPNLKRESRGIELPFWGVDPLRASRRPILSDGSEPNLPAGEVLAPRGSILTLLLRGFVSDLFIHGLGGAKYDPFVDRFALARLEVTLPQFVVASRTRYLFPGDVERYHAAVDLKGRYKEIVSHTERFLDGGIFTLKEKETLGALTAPRAALLEQLRSAPSPEKRSEVAHQLNALNRELKTFLDASSLADAMTAADAPDAAIRAWTCREYPHFVFGGS